ncbi:MAG: DUF423 domain-containing protein [Cyanobacteria bacterium P01_D01_bin.123]
MMRLFLIAGALAGGLSVALGAFATHALAKTFDARSLTIFETAARYQMYHALALVLVGVLGKQSERAEIPLTIAGLGFSLGIVLFCGSLYALSVTSAKWLGAIAPLGGLAFLLGWLGLAIASWRFE